MRALYSWEIDAVERAKEILALDPEAPGRLPEAARAVAALVRGAFVVIKNVVVVPPRAVGDPESSRAGPASMCGARQKRRTMRRSQFTAQLGTFAGSHFSLAR